MSVSWTDAIAVFPRHWIFDTKPVFHLRKDDFQRDGSQVSIQTRCGIDLVVWDRETGDHSVDRQLTIRREHAEKFARLCGNCVRCRA